MNHEIARMIVYLYEFCGPKSFQRIYFGIGATLGSSRDLDKEAYDLFLYAQKFLNEQGYDADGRMIN